MQKLFGPNGCGKTTLLMTLLGFTSYKVIIVEEDLELHIITGCYVSHAVNSALHLGVSEFYVKKGAKITFSMIHNWSRGMEVRPRSASWRRQQVRDHIAGS